MHFLLCWSCWPLHHKGYLSQQLIIIFTSIMFQKIVLAGLVIGLFACQQAPKEKAVAANAPVAPVATAADAQTINISPANSKINWKGTEAADDSHFGTIALKSGKVILSNGQLTGGEFEADMNTIQSDDLKGKKKGELESHLKAEDFFDVAQFPASKFVITAVEKSEATPGFTHRISGNLTLRNITKNISFPANWSLQDGKFKAQSADFNIDRTQWGVEFDKGIIGSIKNKLLEFEIGLRIELASE
jgi:polyisoprenoid-binding protein YceI